MFKKQLSRKIVAVSFTILLLLSGCGSDMKDGTQADKTDAESADLRLFSTDKGEIQIPLHPQRVITNCGLLGDVLALGITPVAIEDYTATDVAYKELIKEIKVLEKWEPEYIMTETPDMIVTNNEDNYEQLSKIGLPQTEAALREVKEGVDWGATLSFEAVPEYMGDYILVTEYGNYQLIENNPVWKSLPAVQNGNVIVLSKPYMYLNDIYSWSAQLDLVTQELLNLVEKNGVPQ